MLILYGRQGAIRCNNTLVACCNEYEHMGTIEIRTWRNSEINFVRNKQFFPEKYDLISREGVDNYVIPRMLLFLEIG